MRPAFPGADKISLGIGPIELPPYVDRPQIVTRSGDNRLHLAEYDRWGEPLKEGVARVLAENLSTIVGTDHVVLFPWKASEIPDYQITVNVTRFDATATGTAVLTARWSILQKEARANLLCHFLLTNPCRDTRHGQARELVKILCLARNGY